MLNKQTLQQLPWEAEVIYKVQESATIVSLGLRFSDEQINKNYGFHPGQFNMLYLYGIGEVPISIVSDPEQQNEFIHTVRAVGRVTRQLVKLKPGDRLGVRGPFGRGWPLQASRGRDVLIVTGGLGCAPAVSVINYVMQRRDAYGRIAIIQGVKHMDDLIWCERYQLWMEQPDTQVLLAANVDSPGWNWHVGLVTDLLSQVELDTTKAVTMICGPEPMMVATARHLINDGTAADQIWLSMERNMQCAVGLCGHCQYGPDFVCKDGPVFTYQRLQHRLGMKGV